MRDAPPVTTFEGVALHGRMALAHAPASAFSNLPFLGGLLHGVVRNAWWDALTEHGGTADGAPYRIVAPAVSQRPWLDAGGGLQFQIVLATSLNAHGEALAQALKGVHELGNGAERYRVSDVQVICLPTAWPVNSPTCGPEAMRTLALTWLTPLHMVSRRQRDAGFGDQPPSLQRIVRSLVRRAPAFAPDWARALGIGTPEWHAEEERWRDAPRLAQDTQTFSWRYGSRTKDSALLRHGLIGRQVFRAPASCRMETLLDAGQCLGVGEGASFGCGGYTLRIE